MKKNELLATIRRFNPQVNAVTSFNGLDRVQKDAALLMEARAIINALMRDGSDSFYTIPEDLLRQFYYLLFVTESDKRPKAKEHDSIVNCLVAGVKVLAIAGVRQMIYPKTLNPVVVTDLLRRFPQEPYKALL